MGYDSSKVEQQVRNKADQRAQEELIRDLQGLLQAFPEMNTAYADFLSVSEAVEPIDSKSVEVARDEVTSRLKESLEAWNELGSMFEEDWPKDPGYPASRAIRENRDYGAEGAQESIETIRKNCDFIETTTVSLRSISSEE